MVIGENCVVFRKCQNIFVLELQVRNLLSNNQNKEHSLYRLYIHKKPEMGPYLNYKPFTKEELILTIDI